MDHNRCPAIVVSGDPAGLFLAGRIGFPGTVNLEKGPRPGRIGEFLDRYKAKCRFLGKSLGSFTNEELVRWYAERRLAIEAEGEGGKLFPASRRASAVLSALIGECELVGVRIENERLVR